MADETTPSQSCGAPPDLSLIAPLDEPAGAAPAAPPEAPGFQPPPPPEPALPAITRAECTKLGLRIFSFGMALPILAAALFPIIQGTVDKMLLGTRLPPLADLELIGLAAYCAVPPMAFLGALLGFDTFQLVSGARRQRNIPGYLWLVLGIVALPYFATFLLVIPLYLHARMREKLTRHSYDLELLRSWLHLLYLIALPIVLFVGTSALRQALKADSRTHEMVVPLLICAWAVIWIGDNLMLLMFASWRSARILAPAPSRSMQFSLGALMLTTFLGGGWVSGLVLIFGK